MLSIFLTAHLKSCSGLQPASQWHFYEISQFADRHLSALTCRIRYGSRPFKFVVNVLGQASFLPEKLDGSLM
jgi:hypothetical protein